MRVTEAPLPGVLILEPTVFEDDRGFFYESFNQQTFDTAVGLSVTFVQDNHSCSKKGVLRGLHYQLPPHAQGKLVRVVQGAAFDVAVDIRRSSRTFGQWFGLTLDAANKLQLWIPAGFAHGFLALEDDTHFLYKTTDLYAKALERAISWDDADIGIRWPILERPRVTAKDAAGEPLSRAEVFD